MLSPLSKIPIAEEALEQIKQLILSGKLQVGDQLPSENQLCDMLQISRTTVRAALIALQSEGYIEIKRGKGAFVIDKILFDKNKFLHWFVENKFKIKELMEARMAIESMAAYLAAAHLTEADLSRLEESIEALKVWVQRGDINEIVAIDEQFHNIIIQASQNKLLTFMYSGITPAVHDYRGRAFSPPANKHLAIDGHTRILAALNSRDRALSYQMMLEHLNVSLDNIVGTAQAISEANVEYPSGLSPSK